MSMNDYILTATRRLACFVVYSRATAKAFCPRWHGLDNSSGCWLVNSREQCSCAGGCQQLSLDFGTSHSYSLAAIALRGCCRLLSSWIASTLMA